MGAVVSTAGSLAFQFTALGFNAAAMQELADPEGDVDMKQRLGNVGNAFTVGSSVATHDSGVSN